MQLLSTLAPAAGIPFPQDDMASTEIRRVRYHFSKGVAALQAAKALHRCAPVTEAVPAVALSQSAEGHLYLELENQHILLIPTWLDGMPRVFDPIVQWECLMAYHSQFLPFLHETVSSLVHQVAEDAQVHCWLPDPQLLGGNLGLCSC